MIGVVKLLITLSEIDDALNKGDNAADSTSENRDDNLNDSFILVTKNKFMNS